MRSEDTKPTKLPKEELEIIRDRDAGFAERHCGRFLPLSEHDRHLLLSHIRALEEEARLATELAEATVRMREASFERVSSSHYDPRPDDVQQAEWLEIHGAWTSAIDAYRARSRTTGEL